MSDGAHVQRLVGQGVKRLEDPRLVVGEGSYLEDLAIDNLADVALVRSPYAHAKILSIDTTAARAMPGVIAVILAEDLAEVGNIPVRGDLKVPPSPPLARAIVKFVGDPVVAIVAEDRNKARDAVDAIVIDFEPLSVVIDPFEAIKPGAALVHDEFESNIVMSSSMETEHIDAAFDAADQRIPVRMGHGRVAAMPIEPRGGIGIHDEETDQYTLYLSTQAAWIERTDVAQALGLPEEQIRVITPDVGGAFGAKMTTYRETVLLLAVAKIIRRPVRWIATRMEDLQSSMHGREAVTDGEVAFDSDGRIRGLKLKTVANLGSYLMKYSGGPPMRMLLFPTGAYTIKEFRSEIVGVFTHSGPMGPYRGAGRPEAAYFIERVMNDVAHALGMDQAEIRRRNFIPAASFPYTNAAGVTYDSGNYEHALDRALEILNYKQATREIAQRRLNGEAVGIGIASCVEVSGGGEESGTVELHEDGHVTVITGASPHGQGLVTSLAQIISDELGVPLSDITVIFGDTSIGSRGGGTMGSRSLQLGGSAIKKAAEHIRKTIMETAARLLEVSPTDLLLHDGRITPAGSPQHSITITEVVSRVVHDQSRGEVNDVSAVHGIQQTIQFQADGDSFPFGTTIAVVSIDRETGRPSIERFISVEDVGHIVNPLLVEGQLIGGIVQGIGETLWEQVVYDEDGQLVTGTLMDYAVPRAKWLPVFELDHTTTPSPTNPLGAKGVGEAGTVHAPPAVANAVIDALRPFAVESLDLPLTMEKLWRVIHFGGAGIR